MFNKTKNYLKKKAKNVMSSGRLKAMALMLLVGCGAAMAQNSAGDYTAGTTALTQVTEEIAKYVPIVYISMNNEEQDVKKKIMMVVGACIFLIAAAQALPLFFGIG